MIMRGFGFAFGQNPADINQPLIDIGPLLDEMDERLRRLQETLNSIINPPPGDPPANLVNRVLWCKSQLETISRDLATMRENTASLAPSTNRDIALSDIASIDYRVNTLLAKANDVMSSLTGSGAENAVSGLEAGVTTVNDLWKKLRARVQQLVPETGNGDVTVTPVATTTTTTTSTSPLLIIGGVVGATLLAALLISK